MAAATVLISRDEDSYSSDSGSYHSGDEDRKGLRSTVAVVQKKDNDDHYRRYSPQRRISPHQKEFSPPRSRRRKKDESDEEKWVEKEEGPPEPKKKKEEIDPILTKTGGAYIPPARLRMMQEQISDKSSVAYQRMSWEALKKSINGLINKVNVANIAEIIRELFQENIVRGRGLMSRSIITAQVASPTFTHVYAALVSIINTKFPQTGELIAKRLVIQFKKGFRRNDKNLCLASVRFIAHLVNQQVLHELLALEILTILLENPTSDSVEVAVGFLKECGKKLTDLSPRGIHAVFESLKGILHDGNVDKRVQYMIEVMFAVRKDDFKEHPAIQTGLDLVDEDDQITHLISVEDELDGEDSLHVFRPDPEFLENEERYKAIREEILGEGSSDDESGEEGEVSDEDEEDDEEEKEEEEMKIIDETQTNLIALRRTVYLTIMSSLDFEECAHKLLKMTIKPGQEMEVANMIIECCSQERSYQRFYGLLGERFCHLNQMWVEKFDLSFQEQYSTVHRLETNKLRNVAKFFAQLFYTDALPWTSLSCVHLNEEETNSSSRIFVKILFQELAEYMGLQKLNERLKDLSLAESFEGLLPRDNPRNTRFAINFFTSIGLGGLTDDLREHLKNAPKMIMAQQQAVESDSDSSSSAESESSDSDDDSSSDSEEERKKRRKRKQVIKKSKEQSKHHKVREETSKEKGLTRERSNGDGDGDDRRKRRLIDEDKLGDVGKRKAVEGEDRSRDDRRKGNDDRRTREKIEDKLREDQKRTPPERSREDQKRTPPERSREDRKRTPPERYRKDRTPPERSREDRKRTPPERLREDHKRTPPERLREDRKRTPPERLREDRKRTPPERSREDRKRTPPERSREDRKRTPPGRSREDRKRTPPERLREDLKRTPPERSREDRKRTPPERYRRDRTPPERSRDHRTPPERSKEDGTPPERSREDRRTSDRSDRKDNGRELRQKRRRGDKDEEKSHHRERSHD